MMMERARSEAASGNGDDTTTLPPAAPTTALPQLPITASQKAERELEARLFNLDRTTIVGSAERAPTSVTAPSVVAQPAISAARAEAEKSNPLLLRIKAAQEKARQAQQKQKTEEQERRKREEEETRQRLATLKEQEQQNIALTPPPMEKNITLPPPPPTYDELQANIDAAVAAKEDNTVLMELDNEPNDLSYLQPPPMEEAAAAQTNDLSYMQPPPPLEDVPMQMNDSELAYMQPPPLEDEPSAPAFAPSAPPAEEMQDPSTLSSSFHGGELPVPISVLDPSTIATNGKSNDAPPSYGELLKEQQTAYFQHEEHRTSPFIAGHASAPSTTHDSSAPAFDFDELGNAMSPSDRLKMEEEQRQILKQIQEEAAANAKAIREAMGTSGMAQQATSTSGFTNATTHSQPHPSERHYDVEVMPPPSAAPATASRSRAPTQIIDVGSGQKVAVHDQAKTREAISRGTALLVECVSCQNWMQISETATLMFCPCCQSVVPIVKQNTVRTREEAIRLQRDRKMAEKLQMEENARMGDDTGVATATSIKNAANNSTSNTRGGEEEISFGSFTEYMSSLFGYGDGTKEKSAATSSSSEILPYPGAASRRTASGQDQAATAASAGGTLYEASIVGRNDREHVLLLEPSNSTDEQEHLLPARVAQQPAHAFSCFETGVVSNIMGKITGKSYGASEDYEQVDFDDELLAMTDRDRLGRADDGPTSEYTCLLDDDDDSNGNGGGNLNDNPSGRGQYEPAQII